MQSIISVILAAVLCVVQYTVAAPTDFHSSSAGFSGAGSVGGPVGYNGPKAVPVILPDGHIADTPAVAAAKNAHYNALAQAKTSQTYSSGISDPSLVGHSGGAGGAAAPVGYNGPQAVPKVLPSGHLADTSDVAAAKGRHYSALAQASATSGFNDGDDGSYKQGGGFHH